MQGHRFNVLAEDNDAPRPLADVVSMAIAVQANVALLRTAETRRLRIDAAAHEIRTPPPGRVAVFRETLIDRRRVQHYSQPELHLRLHEVWGQFCVFCWTLNADDPQRPPAFASLGRDHEMRCQSALELKAAEIEAFLWRMRFEQRLRHEVGFRDAPGFQSALEAARRMPAMVFDRPVVESDDHALLVAACEHAGMLAAVRWIGNDRWAWGQEGIMDIDEAAITGGSP